MKLFLPTTLPTSPTLPALKLNHAPCCAKQTSFSVLPAPLSCMQLALHTAHQSKPYRSGCLLCTASSDHFPKQPPPPVSSKAVSSKELTMARHPGWFLQLPWAKSIQYHWEKAEALMIQMCPRHNWHTCTLLLEPGPNICSHGCGAESV